MISESNVCRSVFGMLFLQRLLKEYQLDGWVHVESKATRPYSVGEFVENSVFEVMKELDLDQQLDDVANIVQITEYD